MKLANFKSNFIILILCASSYFNLSGCQTSKLFEFNKVQLGQEKHDVLETMGNPSRMIRVNSEDRWYYDMYDEKQVKLEKAVHFFQGQVVYKGDPVEPFISAELQDKINEKKNIELSRKETKKTSASQ